MCLLRPQAGDGYRRTCARRKAPSAQRRRERPRASEECLLTRAPSNSVIRAKPPFCFLFSDEKLLARGLNSIGREASRAALRKIMARGQASGLLAGRPDELAEQFSGLLWGHLMVSLLLGVAERPNPREIAGCARDAAAAFLQLHPLPMEHAPE